RVNSTQGKFQQLPAAAMDSSGIATIVWQSKNQDGSGAGVFARRYDALGNVLTGELQINNTKTGNQNKPSVAAAPGGAFVVAWTSGNNQDGSNNGIYARRYNSSATAQGNEFLVNTHTNNSQDWSAAGKDGSGNFTIAWSS